MFERYTEKARRVVFFARYEASQFGSSEIETQHLLLGLLREDKAFARRFLRSGVSAESIRKKIEEHTVVHEKVPTSVDLPLSQESKLVLAYAWEEADRLSHKHIDAAHLLLGLLREEKCLAAEILRSCDVQVSTIQEELSRVPLITKPPMETPLLTEFSRDLTEAAAENQLDPLVGRDNELERVVHILCRRTKNNAVLLGEPGVGKAALVRGLAVRIANGNVPSLLADKRILALDLSPIMAGARLSGQFEARLRSLVRELRGAENAIIFIEELYALRGAEGLLDTADILKPALSRGEIQCLGAASPADYRQSVEKEPWLERCFQAVKVPPPSEADAVKILLGIRGRYEKFHDVQYTDESLQYAVQHSVRYIPERHLPDKAIDLMDEAGACVKLRQSALPQEVAEAQKRLQVVMHRMEMAIAIHEFEKARFYSEEERKERENLRQLREKHQLDTKSPPTVTRQDIEEVLTRWTGVAIRDQEVPGSGA